MAKFCLFALFSCPHSPSPPMTSVAIRAVLDKQVADWNRGDIPAFVQTYAEQCTFVGKTVVEGRAGVEARYRKAYPNAAAMGHPHLRRPQNQASSIATSPSSPAPSTSPAKPPMVATPVASSASSSNAKATPGSLSSTTRAPARRRCRAVEPFLFLSTPSKTGTDVAPKLTRIALSTCQIAYCPSRRFALFTATVPTQAQSSYRRFVRRFNPKAYPHAIRWTCVSNSAHRPFRFTVTNLRQKVKIFLTLTFQSTYLPRTSHRKQKSDSRARYAQRERQEKEPHHVLTQNPPCRRARSPQSRP